jgi:hypothetical protein
MAFQKVRTASLMVVFLFGLCLNSGAQSSTLNFNTLPSDPSQCLSGTRCWVYQAFNGDSSFTGEQRAFTPEGDRLLMDTVGMEWQLGGGGNAYHLDNVTGNPVVEPSHSFSITAVLQVLDYEHYDYQTGQGAKTFNGDQNVSTSGFCFGAYTGVAGEEVYFACMSDARLMLDDTGVPFDTTVKHEYRLEVLPGIGAKLFVVGDSGETLLTLTTGRTLRASYDQNVSALWLGDFTGGANAKVEIHKFAYTSHASD